MRKLQVLAVTLAAFTIATPAQTLTSKDSAKQSSAGLKDSQAPEPACPPTVCVVSF